MCTTILRFDLVQLWVSSRFNFPDSLCAIVLCICIYVLVYVRNIESFKRHIISFTLFLFVCFHSIPPRGRVITPFVCTTYIPYWDFVITFYRQYFLSHFDIEFLLKIIEWNVISASNKIQTKIKTKDTQKEKRFQFFRILFSIFKLAFCIFAHNCVLY